MVDFGTDIDRSWSVNNKGDFKIVSGTDNAAQAIYNRVTIKLDELIQLGYTGYGNQANDLMGSTDIEVTNQQIIVYTQTCLLEEPRVSDIQNITCDYNGKVGTVEATVMLIGEDTPNNLIFPVGGGN